MRHIEIEARFYRGFLNQWYQKKFGNQRFGQAFYNHFELHKMTDKHEIEKLYEASEDEAREIIKDNFRFN